MRRLRLIKIGLRLRLADVFNSTDQFAFVHEDLSSNMHEPHIENIKILQTLNICASKIDCHRFDRSLSHEIILSFYALTCRNIAI